MAKRKLIDLRDRVPKEFVAYRRTPGALQAVPNLKFRPRYLVATGPYDLTERSLKKISLRAPRNAVAFMISPPFELFLENNPYTRDVSAVQFFRRRRKNE